MLPLTIPSLNEMGFRYFSMRPFRVYLSHSNLDHIDPNYIFKIKSMIPHPRFNASALINDIGIIKLDGKIELGSEKHKKGNLGGGGGGARSYLT